jgi:MFS family permease
MADIYGANDRGKALAIAAFAPYLGPALGPILGGLVSQHIHWHWLFWAMSLLDAAIVLLGFLTLRESYKPVLVRRQMRVNETLPMCDTPSKRRNLHDVGENILQLRTGLSRPLRLLWRRPILQILTFLYGLNFGVYAVVLSTFATLYIERYHQSEGTASLHYTALAIGCTIASQGGGRLMDIIWRRLTARRERMEKEGKAQKEGDSQVVPEYRVPLFALGAMIAPCGLIWYGWAAENLSHWVLVDAGVVVFVVGGFLDSQALLAYLLDEFKDHAASAGAAERTLAYTMGFTFPIFAPQLYQSLGYGWGNTLLAMITAAVMWPMAPLLWMYGPRIRAIDRGRKD